MKDRFALKLPAATDGSRKQSIALFWADYGTGFEILLNIIRKLF